jgi:hypothetical protein
LWIHAKDILCLEFALVFIYYSLIYYLGRYHRIFNHGTKIQSPGTGISVDLRERSIAHSAMSYKCIMTIQYPVYPDAPERPKLLKVKALVSSGITIFLVDHLIGPEIAVVIAGMFSDCIPL